MDGDAPFIVFFFFELWDYIPTILVIATITSHSRSVGVADHTQRNVEINMASRIMLLNPGSASKVRNYSSIAQSEQDSGVDLQDEVDENDNINNHSVHGSAHKTRKNRARSGSGNSVVADILGAVTDQMSNIHHQQTTGAAAAAVPRPGSVQRESYYDRAIIRPDVAATRVLNRYGGHT